MAQLDRVREAVRLQPFRPFQLRLLEGRSFVVKHPDFIALPPTPRKRDLVFYDEVGLHIVDLALIQEITLAGEEDPASPASHRPQQ